MVSILTYPILTCLIDFALKILISNMSVMTTQQILSLTERLGNYSKLLIERKIGKLGGQ